MKHFVKLLLVLGILKFVQLFPLIDILDLSSLGNEIYGTPDEQIGEIVKGWSPDSGINPEELGSYFEGDILVPNEAKNGLLRRSSFWQDGIVPYVFDESVPDSDRAVVQECIDIYSSKTCIKFVQRVNESDYVLIKNTQTGCWSSVGRIGGKQEINLQSGGCTSKIGTPCHEMMHALGFLHEQSRSDRDKYVRILRQNIQPEYALAYSESYKFVWGPKTMNNFRKSNIFQTTTYKVPYNVRSVMHYGAYAFSKNQKKTIELRNGSDIEMGQRDGFAETDLQKINIRYKCTSFLDLTESTTNGNIGSMINGLINNVGAGVGDIFSGFGAKSRSKNQN